MNERAKQRRDFLRHSGWGRAVRHPITGDASARRYSRLKRGSRRAILMDCPPDTAGKIGPFLFMDEILRNAGFSAPEIYAEDQQNGLIVMEDLGDGLFARIIDATPEMETPLYTVATEVLLRLHDLPPPAGLKTYSAAEMASAIDVTFDYYCRTKPTDAERISAMLETVLRDFSGHSDVIILRDYHAENLLWLPERSGVQRAGLLDFQDALIGHRAYDLMSLLQDARRDVSPSCVGQMIALYCERSGADAEAFKAACAAQAAQRNLRILGIFARLSRIGGKPRYVDLVPRVWSHLMSNLEHPAMAPLRPLVQSSLPEPDRAHLDWLRLS